MRRLGVFLVAFLVVITACSVDCLACTSFAVYSDRTYYGMNFDHSIDDIRFSIHSGTGTKVFSMDFFSNGAYHPTVWMSNQGFFAACQLVYPQQDPVRRSSHDQLDMFELFSRVPFETSRVKEIRDIASEKTLICQYNFVHTLFADATGDAIVLETNNHDNWVTDSVENRIVMTNFFVSGLQPDSAMPVTGVGADRYVKARAQIDAHFDSFSYADGMNALQTTVQEHDSPYPTQCSLLFDPADGRVFIVAKRDFGKVWQVDISRGTIEAYSGFDSHWASTIGVNGLLLRNLRGTGGSLSSRLQLLAVIAVCCLSLAWLAVRAVLRPANR